ncbi:sensor histidine kinase [Cohaesibacter celericrescens]|uniref:sensor histidine kinase n=1 Tax=Cohaesibacter celericrescens TaxID=2067669 RepID=UPI003561EE8E
MPLKSNKAELIATRYLAKDMCALVQDPARVEAVFRSVGPDVFRDPDFDTLIDMLLAQTQAKLAFVAIVTDRDVWYQSKAGEGAYSAVLTDFISISCLEEKCSWVPVSAFSPNILKYETHKFNSTNASIHVSGVPLVVNGVTVGSLCLINDAPVTSSGFRDVLARCSKLAASLYELKHAAKNHVLSELNLSQANMRHALALKAGGIATWGWDLREDVVDCDQGLLDFYDLETKDKLRSSTLFERIIPDDIGRVKDEIQTALLSDEDFFTEFQLQNGTYILIIGHVFERSDDGEPLHVLGVAIDLSESKKSEAKTRLLLREVNHRAKNMLAILQSLAGQTMRHTQSAQEFTRAFSGRLQALAASHTLLSDQEWDDTDVYALLKIQLLPYTQDYSNQVEINGPAVLVNADVAVALGLVFHELATNALRFGALSKRDGKVKVFIEQKVTEKGNWLNLLWRETGGVGITRPATEGFGSLLIRSSLNKIVGSRVHIDYASQGIAVDISIPLKYQ